MQVAAGTSSMLATFAMTAPSLIWLTLRFGSIFSKPAIRHHLLKSGSTQSTAFLLHVYTGVLVMIAGCGVLAYALLPTKENQNTPFVQRPWVQALLTAISLALVATNVSVLWLLAGRNQFKRYQVTPRQMSRGLSLLHATILQMTAMAGTPLCIIYANHWKLYKLIATICLAMYWLAITVSYLEIRVDSERLSNDLQGRSWEDSTWWGRTWWALLPAKSQSKPQSKLTQAFVKSSFANQQIIFTAFLVICFLSFVQAANLSLVQDPSAKFLEDPRFIAFGNFYVGLVLYQTLVMSAGVFTMSQTLFDGQELEEKNKKDDTIDLTLQIRMHRTRLLYECFFTQALPILLMSVGSSYSSLSNMDFLRMVFALR